MMMMMMMKRRNQSVCEKPTRDLAGLNQIHVSTGERDLNSTTENGCIICKLGLLSS